MYTQVSRAFNPKWNGNSKPAGIPPDPCPWASGRPNGSVARWPGRSRVHPVGDIGRDLMRDIGGRGFRHDRAWRKPRVVAGGLPGFLTDAGSIVEDRKPFDQWKRSPPDLSSLAPSGEPSKATIRRNVAVTRRGMEDRAGKATRLTDPFIRSDHTLVPEWIGRRVSEWKRGVKSGGFPRYPIRRRFRRRHSARSRLGRP